MLTWRKSFWVCGWVGGGWERGKMQRNLEIVYKKGLSPCPQHDFLFGFKDLATFRLNRNHEGHCSDRPCVLGNYNFLHFI